MTAAKKTHKSRSPVRRGSTLQSSSRQAKQLAAAILEVLAGTHTPMDAAKALGIAVPRYYILEQRALEGLLKACEPRRVGRGHQTPQRQIAALEKEIARLKQECTRQQSLVRAAQRTVGLSIPQPPKTSAKAAARKKRKRRPTVRALKAVAALKDDVGPPAAPVVQSMPDGKGPESPQERHSTG